MDKIKAFFEKKKVSKKFKNAGPDHALSTDSVITNQNVHDSAEMHQNATKASLKRLELMSKTTTTRSVKMEAKRQLETEKQAQNNSNESVAQVVSDSTGHEEKVLDAAPMLSVAGVFYICDLFGDDVVLTKEDMRCAIETYLRECLTEEPLVASSIMIQSLNRNAEVRRNYLQVLSKYVDNLIKSPNEKKFLKIRMLNKVFSEKVAGVTGAVEFLNAVGFNEIGEFLVISQDVCSVTRLLQAKECQTHGQPVPLKLYRNPLVLKPSPEPVENISLPPEFFERTVTEVVAEQT